MLDNPLLYLGFRKPDSYNSFAAGAKQYGPEGRMNPTSGPVNKDGYQERDMVAKARRNAILQRMQAQQSGNYFSPEYLRGVR